MVGGAAPEAIAARRRAGIITSLLILYLIWGTTYYALRVAVAELPPFGLAALRFAIAGPLLLLVLRARGASFPTKKEWIDSAKVAALLLVISNGGISFAQKTVSSSLSAIVVSSMPLWATLFSAFFGSRPSRRDLLGLAVGFVGVVTLNLGGEMYAGGWVAVALLVAPISWAFGSMWGRKLSLPKGPMAPATQMIIASACLWIISSATGETWPSQVGLWPALSFAYLTIFGSLVSLIAYAYLLQNTRPAIATSYAYVNPLIAVTIGVGLAGEAIAPLTWAGGAVIVAGVVIVLTKRS